LCPLHGRKAAFLPMNWIPKALAVALTLLVLGAACGSGSRRTDPPVRRGRASGFYFASKFVD